MTHRDWGLAIIILSLLIVGISVVKSHEIISAILICTSILLSFIGMALLKLDEINNKLK